MSHPLPSCDMPVTTLRDDDPRTAELLAGGARVVAESWGARLEVVDPGPLRALVRRVTDRGLVVGELTASEAAEVLDLETATRPDYPDGPATPRPDLDAAGAARLFTDGGRVFGVRDDGLLVAVTAVEQLPDRAETAFTSVRATHRGRGVGTAVKAASVLALAADGVRRFGTGGAGDNAASLGMNRAVGYRVTERWLTLES